MLGATCADAPLPCSVSGTFAATASAGTATSSTRTVTVPPGNSGRIRFSFVDVGTVLLAQANNNGGGFASFVNGEILVFTDTATLAIKTTGDNAGESRTYTLTDADTGIVIGGGVHTGA